MIFVSNVCKSSYFKRKTEVKISCSSLQEEYVLSLMSIFWCIASHDIDFSENSATCESFREQPFLLALHVLFFTAG